MRRYTRKLLALANPQGNVENLQKALELVPELDVDAVALLGNLTSGNGEYKDFFRVLGRSAVPVFYVPGQQDAPARDYLREAYNIEVAFPHLHGVHGSFAFGPGHVIFAGMGGDISESGQERDEESQLRYPAWEVEYRLKVLYELRDYLKIFLFQRAPAHKGLHESGSQELAELIKTHNPRLVVSYDNDYQGSVFGHEWLGSSLIVVPGSLAEGDFSVVDVLESKVETGNVR